MLRKKGVVGKFVEFYGAGLSSLPVADRTIIGNMSPEYGSTVAIFPIDALTLEYLRLTGRSAEQIALVEAYAKAQGMFRTDDSPAPRFTDTLELDLGDVEPNLAGPRRPQDRVPLSGVKPAFAAALAEWQTARAEKLPAAAANRGGTAVAVDPRTELSDGAVVIAAITSCTNTSNSSRRRRSRRGCALRRG
jgi:aconitate hydratase